MNESCRVNSEHCYRKMRTCIPRCYSVPFHGAIPRYYSVPFPGVIQCHSTVSFSAIPRCYSVPFHSGIQCHSTVTFHGGIGWPLNQEYWNTLASHCRRWECWCGDNLLSRHGLHLPVRRYSWFVGRVKILIYYYNFFAISDRMKRQFNILESKLWSTIRVSRRTSDGCIPFCWECENRLCPRHLNKNNDWKSSKTEFFL